MIDKFLKARHWQLFILMIGLPIIFQFSIMTSMFFDIKTESDSEPNMMLNYINFLPFMMIIFTSLFFGWFWSIAIGLQKRIPKNISMKVKKFKIFFFIPMIYILLISIFIGVSMNGLIGNQNKPNEGMIFGIAGVVLILHLFSMFCIFYILYFVTKTLKTAELQREVNFGDFIGEFFLLWFYPIGIWIIQPRINRLIEK